MNNNGQVAPEQQIRVMASLPESDAVEFSLPLHVVKKCGRDGNGDTYTIAVWEGMVLHSLCLSQPLETALSVVGSCSKFCLHCSATQLSNPDGCSP